MAKNKKLEMVPAGKGEIGMSLAVTQGLVTQTTEMPKKLKKLSAPPLLKIDNIPVGAMVDGVIIAIVPSISSRADMKNSKLIHLRKEVNGNELDFLLPLSGTIKKAVGDEAGLQQYIGKRLFVKRNPDGETTKYGGKKKMFMLDVSVEE